MGQGLEGGVASEECEAYDKGVLDEGICLKTTSIYIGRENAVITFASRCTSVARRSRLERGKGTRVWAPGREFGPSGENPNFHKNSEKAFSRFLRRTIGWACRGARCMCFVFVVRGAAGVRGGSGGR